MVGLNTIINKIQSTSKLIIWLQIMYFLPLAVKNQRKFKEYKFYFEHIVKINKTNVLNFCTNYFTYPL